MNLFNKYIQDYNFSIKHDPIDNISIDFTKAIKLLNNNNYIYSNNKINLSNEKLFQNEKYYKIIKPKK